MARTLVPIEMAQRSSNSKMTVTTRPHNLAARELVKNVAVEHEEISQRRRFEVGLGPRRGRAIAERAESDFRRRRWFRHIVRLS